MSYSRHGWGGLWESTASCIHLLNLSQPSVPDAFSHVLPAFTTREIIPSNIPKEGQQAWMTKYSLCFPYVQFQCNCTTCNFFLILTHVFLYGLCKAAYCIMMCVFLKEDITTSVYCLCLCQVQLVGLVCLSPFLDRGFSCSAPGHMMPNGKTAFYSRGVIKLRILLLFFTW